MNKTIIVYHGSADRVEEPICNIGRTNLDFGLGFYVTDMKEQAIRWTKRVVAEKKTREAFLNIYTLDKASIVKEARCKIFTSYNVEWLRFVIANRRGENAAADYDYIEGGVADDRVINTINMYMQGYYSEEHSLRLLALHRPNNQICIRKQEFIDKYLHYERTEFA